MGWALEETVRSEDKSPGACIFQRVRLYWKHWVVPWLTARHHGTVSLWQAGGFPTESGIRGLRHRTQTPQPWQVLLLREWKRVFWRKKSDFLEIT